ncbi:MAG: 1,4-alpha-glucan branching protein GlgB [Pseudomonadota bacterium]|nr:1,4-alpha-glucan branching protein GlgB [Pseudomonadota bacterium]
MKTEIAPTLLHAQDPDLLRLVEARHYNPLHILGRHPSDDGVTVRVFLPLAKEVWLEPEHRLMHRIPGTDLFYWTGPADTVATHPEIRWIDQWDHLHQHVDPYSFPPQLDESELAAFHHGEHVQAWRLLGAQHRVVDGVEGTLFATWAPNAERVSVVGDFNRWDGRRHPMCSRGYSGVWELFIPGLEPGALYKFEIRNSLYGTIHVKTDPYARCYELRPSTAARITGESSYEWGDDQWLAGREGWQHSPMSIYEVHLGSWQRANDGGFLGYRELADRLVEHVSGLGFTHIELLPVTEHPFDGSWGYQTTGYFAPTSRFGEPDDFRYFVDRMHQAGIGVLLDWVPGHFPKDDFALARFDGSALYEHEDSRRGEHREWGTLVFNYGRCEIKSFLISSALYWLKEYHIDGLRVDAVASMLYLDYSREPGEWLPNQFGGNENLEAVEFMRELNIVTHRECPGAVIVAEESTAWPQVTRPTYLGGLGFSMKWNMGWMHDTLRYFSKDPVHRHYHHNDLTFGLLYAFTENFVLPFSHDEVVHGKGSMWQKMPGDEWQKFANLRLLYTYMFTYPGKKLLFMGAELAQPWEWSHDTAMPWHLANDPARTGLQRLLGDLNRHYRALPALHQYEFEERGFSWIDCHDASQSVISYIRKTGEEFLVIALNFTPVPREKYRIGVPAAGDYEELLNSDAECYGGSNLGNGGHLNATPEPWMGYPASMELTLPPLAGVVLRLTNHG